jgi:glycosyltransferase involved in cell wall biosynthesis
VRIAFVTGDAPWPSTAGGRLRDVATYEAAASVGQVCLVSFPFVVQPDAADLPPGSRIERMPWPRSSQARVANRLRATLHRRHVFQQHLIDMGALPRLEAALADIRPDVTIMGYPLYGDLLKVARPLSPRLFVDLTELRLLDAKSRQRAPNPIAGRMRARLDAYVIGRVERDVARYADEVWFVTEADADAYRAATGAATRVIPNTVPAATLAHYQAIRPAPGAYAFLGAFDHGANLRAAKRLVERIHPLVRDREPSARLSLIGRRPPDDLRRLVEDTPGVTMHGDVADAVGELAATGPLAAPLEWGSGTKLKLLEAAAAGVPIVTSPQGLEGLDFEPGHDILVASTDSDFATAVLRLWHEPALVERLRAGAIDRVLHQYDRPVAAQAIRAALEARATER